MRTWPVLAAVAGVTWVGAAPAAPRDGAAPWPGADRVAESLPAIHAATPRHGDRLTALSALFLGRPYGESPLGEGPGAPVDPDPIARFDRFDCVTFVEEVMALAWHAELAPAVAELQRIRYSAGSIRYGARKHLMIAQWIPENVASGFVRDVTAEVAGARTRIASIDLTDASFASARDGHSLDLPAEDRPLGHHEIPIVPVERTLELAGRIPHGTVISTVRVSRPGTPHRVTHVGLLLVVRGVPVVRHAHRGLGRVVEQPLGRYLEAAQRRQRWPIEGFNLLAIAPFSPTSAPRVSPPARGGTP